MLISIEAVGGSSAANQPRIKDGGLEIGGKMKGLNNQQGF